MQQLNAINGERDAKQIVGYPMLQQREYKDEKDYIAYNSAKLLAELPAFTFFIMYQAPTNEQHIRQTMSCRLNL